MRRSMPLLAKGCTCRSISTCTMYSWPSSRRNVTFSRQKLSPFFSLGLHFKFIRLSLYPIQYVNTNNYNVQIGFLLRIIRNCGSILFACCIEIIDRVNQGVLFSLINLHYTLWLLHDNTLQQTLHIYKACGDFIAHLAWPCTGRLMLVWPVGMRI